MKVLLIAPQPKRIPLNISGVYALPPLGLAYIAAFLRKNYIDVDIIDMPALNLNSKDITAQIKNNQYDLCGISCNIFNIDGGIQLAHDIKNIDPDLTLVLGGRCTAFSAEILLQRSKFDVIVYGEGETTMLELCGAKAAGKGFEVIAGIAFRVKDKIIKNQVKDSFIELDSLPLPARDLLPNSKYKMHPPFNIYPPLTLVETSRGCNFNCNFCSLSSVLRLRSPQSVLAEIAQLISQFGINEIYFVDPNFTSDKQRVEQICRGIIKSKFNIHWTCKTRVDSVDENLIKLMAQAGCYMISYGVESGEQDILDELNKSISVDMTKQAFALSQKYGIRTMAYVMIGSPGENETSFQNTMSLLKTIKPDYVLFGELLPDPRSSLTKEKIKDNKITEDELFDFYVFGKEMFKQFNLYGVERKKIKQWMYSGFLNFYLTPGYIAKRLFKVKNWLDFSNLVKGFLLVVKDKIKKKSLLKWVK